MSNTVEGPYRWVWNETGETVTTPEQLRRAESSFTAYGYQGAIGSMNHVFQGYAAAVNSFAATALTPEQRVAIAHEDHRFIEDALNHTYNLKDKGEIKL